MAKLVNALHEDLRPYVYEDGMIHHPLIIRELPCKKDQIEEINLSYLRKKAQRDEYLQGVRYQPFNYLFLHERAYRLKAFRQIRHLISDAKYWRMLEWVWSDAEYLTQNKKVWLPLLNSKRRYRLLMMNRKDRKAFEAMPVEFTIYRGHKKGIGRNGLSWTLSRDKAVWFAYRFAESDARTHMLLTGTCKKSDVFCYTSGRKEEEIIIDPAKIEGIREVPNIGPSPFGAGGV